MHGFFSHAINLHRIAVGAHNQTLGDQDDRAGTFEAEAQIAIVFSAAAVEAVVNESVALADFLVHHSSKTDAVLAAYRDVLGELDNLKVQLLVRIQVAALLLTGKRWDKGAELHRNLDALVDLRNKIMHTRPLDQITAPLSNQMPPDWFVPASVLKKIESCNILAPTSGTLAESWIGRIGTRAVCKWACNTAADATEAFTGLFPQDSPIRVRTGMFQFDRL